MPVNAVLAFLKLATKSINMLIWHFIYSYCFLRFSLVRFMYTLIFSKIINFCFILTLN